jgi:hypothetical protein
MLTRVNAALFEGDLGEQVQLFVAQQGNGGVETAKFEYNNVVLPTQTIQGHPGCEFTLVGGIHQFECIVVFNPASSSARYDLFQVNGAGGATSLNKSATSDSGGPIIGFGIDGVPVAAPAGTTASPRLGKHK